MTIENTDAATPQGQSADTAPAAQVDEIQPGQEQAEGQPKEETEQAEKPKPEVPKGVQKRLDELTRLRNEERREKERLYSLLEQTLVKGQAPKVDAPSGPPSRDQFETYEDYQEAKTDWMLSQRFRQLEEKAAKTKQEEAVKQRETSWNERLEKASATREDFEEVVFADGLPITPVMVEAMKDSDIGPDVAYYLGKNPSEAKRISQLGPAAQVREIGKIEAKLELKSTEPAKRASKAPAPIEPVSSGKASANTDPEKMTQAEYEAWRAKQGARWAK